MDQELKAYLDEREARMSERFDQAQARTDERFAQMQAHMDERFKQAETEGRHTRILVEGLHDNIRLIAEAVVGTNERIDTLREETTGRLDEIKGTVVTIQQTLVPRLQNLENRVQNLENRAERQNLDVIEVVRERFGLRKTS